MSDRNIVIIQAILCSIAVAAVASFLLYDSWRVMLITPVLFIPIQKVFRKREQEKHMAGLREDFLIVLGAVEGDLRAGLSMENAWKESLSVLQSAHSDAKRPGYMEEELKRMCRSLELNIPLERLLYDFAKKTNEPDILNFAEVFGYAKRGSGNLAETVEHTVAIIREKGEVQKEIEVLVASKRMEQRVMNLMPIFMLLYLRITASNYLSALYHNVGGVIAMSICAAIYAITYWLSQKILRIEV